MPWCPKCKYEYISGISVCPDCGSEIMDTLSPLSEVIIDTPLFLTTAKDSFEANIIESKLHEFNIPMLKKDKEAGGYMSVVMGVSYFNVDIYVPSRFYEQSIEILNNTGDAFLAYEDYELRHQNITQDEIPEMDQDDTATYTIAFVIFIVVIMLFYFILNS